MENAVQKCEVCATNSAKYCCPKCSAHSCSLDCVKVHKRETDCDGIRNRSSFVALGSFDELALLSDYRFLEETDRCIDNAARYPMKRPKNEVQDTKLPYRLYRLVTECRKRGTCLLIMPEIFQRRKHNTTYYNFKAREFLWHVELDFPQANTKYSVKQVSEKSTLGEMLEPYLSTEMATREVSDCLRYYQAAGYGGITPLMRVERIRSREPQYVELDFTETIMANLVGKTIVEFPTIVLVLQLHRFCYHILGKETKPERQLEEGEIESSSDEEEQELPTLKVHSEALSPKNSHQQTSAKANAVKLVADYSMSDTDTE